MPNDWWSRADADREDEVREDYVDMKSPTRVIDNPLYFDDNFVPAPSTNAPSYDVPAASPRDNYYNCPPPVAVPVNRQTSQV